MKMILLSLLFTNILNGISAQSYHDIEFSSKKTENCTSKGMCKEIFLKVEKDPLLIQVDKNQFSNFISMTVNDMNLGVDQNGIIKLKIFFFIDGLTCINEIGTKDILLDYSQMEILSTISNSIKDVEYGEQRHIKVSSQGILFLDIRNGKLKDLRNVNFGFR